MQKPFRCVVFDIEQTVRIVPISLTEV